MNMGVWVQSKFNFYFVLSLCVGTCGHALLRRGYRGQKPCGLILSFHHKAPEVEFRLSSLHNKHFYPVNRLEFLLLLLPPSLLSAGLKGRRALPPPAKCWGCSWGPPPRSFVILEISMVENFEKGVGLKFSGVLYFC